MKTSEVRRSVTDRSEHISVKQQYPCPTILSRCQVTFTQRVAKMKVDRYQETTASTRLLAMRLVGNKHSHVTSYMLAFLTP
eukprot:767139-Hanusia_phi.AAC.3